MGAAWYEAYPCANCGAELPERGWKRRRVPRLGGKRRRVCLACAKAIDEQGTLDVEPDKERGAA